MSGRGRRGTSARFVELDVRPTPMGELVLRRRRPPDAREDVFEVKLGDDFLMSSMFTVAEEEMARLALAEVAGTDLDVVVGGLGLGYTAKAVLEDPRVGRLLVVEALADVVDWHHRGLVPVAATLTSDPRCALVHADFFATLRSGAPFDPAAASAPAPDVDAFVVDIDHSPRHLLDPGHADFYGADGLARVAARLRPGGVFVLWSNDPPDDAFTATLATVFAGARADVVRFPNPLQDREAAHTVYVATVAGPPAADVDHTRGRSQPTGGPSTRG